MEVVHSDRINGRNGPAMDNDADVVGTSVTDKSFMRVRDETAILRG